MPSEPNSVRNLCLGFLLLHLWIYKSTWDFCCRPQCENPHLLVTRSLSKSVGRNKLLQLSHIFTRYLWLLHQDPDGQTDIPPPFHLPRGSVFIRTVLLDQTIAKLDKHSVSTYSQPQIYKLVNWKKHIDMRGRTQIKEPMSFLDWRYVGSIQIRK